MSDYVVIKMGRLYTLVEAPPEHPDDLEEWPHMPEYPPEAESIANLKAQLLAMVAVCERYEDGKDVPVHVDGWKFGGLLE